MADDATGSSKPPARRRRSRKSTPADAPQGAGTGAGTGTDSEAPAEVSRPGSSTSASAIDDGVVDIWPMSVAARDDQAICPFLRAIDGDGMLVDPVEAPDQRNRCAALAEAAPQSVRQQELVCLTGAHTTCPRYLRGAAVETQAPVERTITASKLTPATIGALALLAAAFSASVMFMVARGGLDLPAAAGTSPGPSASAVAVVPSSPPSVAPSVIASEI
jgi:hypothetical protein